MQTGLLVFTDFVGIVAFALAGILAAEGKNVDPVGVFVMAFTTAFGGGIVRDLIIDNRPLYWIAHEEYVWVTLLMTAVAPVLMGVCTGVFGGLLRDVFLNRLPMVMSDQQPYASAAFVGGWVYVLLNYCGVSEFAAVFGATFLIVALRMICWYCNWEVLNYHTRRKTCSFRRRI